MCLSIPGKVVSVSEGSAEIDYGSVKVSAKTRAIKPKVGDYVLVQGKHVTHIFDPKKAEEILSEIKAVLNS